MRQRCVDQAPVADQVDVDDSREHVRVEQAKRASAADPGVREDDVDPAGLGDHLRHGSVNLSLVGDVADGGDRVRAAARRCLLEPFGFKIKQRESVVYCQPARGC